ncbi:hypothetical protein CDAR_304931 [Caerostris darwini]|uniref:Uncharacterized protein n=1 Tax=Caerostris darwini TaxID=1538125 RepID=A0AAV4QA77_9ARAC|nr:hypothetical protein CDAR_304931 [Caerostris darwini]
MAVVGKVIQPTAEYLTKEYSEGPGVLFSIPCIHWVMRDKSLSSDILSQPIRKLRWGVCWDLRAQQYMAVVGRVIRPTAEYLTKEYSEGSPRVVPYSEYSLGNARQKFELRHFVAANQEAEMGSVLGLTCPAVTKRIRKTRARNDSNFVRHSFMAVVGKVIQPTAEYLTKEYSEGPGVLFSIPCIHWVMRDKSLSSDILSQPIRKLRWRVCWVLRAQQ